MITNILNVQINTEKKSVILKKTEILLKDGQQHYLVTPNPEIVMQAVDDPDYLAVLNKADLKLPDGVGLKLASWLSGSVIQERIKGVDFVQDLCRLAEHNSYSIFFLGGDDGVALKTAELLQRKFPKLKIKGSAGGGAVYKDGLLQNNEILVKINKLKPDILFVAFGFPKQEKFIARYLSELPSVRLAIGVGGAFDFLSGKVKRAPKLLRVVGLEWLWRLMVEPRRLGRICVAVIVFPFKFLQWKIDRISKL